MVPPGLSLSLSIGIEYAQVRLQGKGVVAVKGRLINAAGRMKAIYFDKTGTLTINEMKVQSVIFSDREHEMGKKPKLIDLDYDVKENSTHKIISLSNPKSYNQLMVHFITNHTLTYFKNQILGDPMEHELFGYGDGKLADSNEQEDRRVCGDMGYIKKVLMIDDDTVESGVSTHYVVAMLDFKSELQRMSVVVRSANDMTDKVFTKGAPERVLKLCLEETIPTELEGVIRRLSQNGYRILAFGCKTLPTGNSGFNQSRDYYESGLTFQGLAIFKNNLKEETKPTIEGLKNADFKVGMITGDNINTAISIARNCRILEPKKETIGTYSFSRGTLNFSKLEEIEIADTFDLDHGKQPPSSENQVVTNINRTAGAIDSENFARIVEHLKLEEKPEIDIDNPIIIELSSNCRVFARMNPEQKGLIIRMMKQFYKSKDYTVGFCGDGANDCIALKEADIGVSLAMEASLSAPFISSVQDISCIISISSEGKGALITNFDCFRFFCMYSIITTFGLMYLFALKLEYSDAVYITSDIVIALNLANCIGLLKPWNRLIPDLPKSTLFYKEFMLSIGLNCLVSIAYFFLGAYLVKLDPNYKPPSEIIGSQSGSPEGNVITFETTVGFVESDGRSFRDPGDLSHGCVFQYQRLVQAEVLQPGLYDILDHSLPTPGCLPHLQ